MTAIQPAVCAAPQTGAVPGVRTPRPRERTPWLLAGLCLLISILPSYVVPYGPLKSYGSPAKLIAIMLFGLAAVGFLLIRRTAKTRSLRPGVVIILLYFLAVVMVYGVGLSHSRTALVAAASTREIVILVANVGVALYAMTRVETVRQRSVVLGCLAVGLTFNCVVGLLQNAAHVDLHLLFEPPWFVVNGAGQGLGTDADVIERLGAVRAIGTSGHPIEFSVLAAITVPLTLHFARYGASSRTRQLAAAAAGIALFATPAGVSRSGVVALVAALLVYMWTLKLRAFGIAVLTGAIGVLVEFLAAHGTARALWQTITGSAQDQSVLERVGDYARVSETFTEHPVFGLGLGGSTPAEYGFLDNEWLQAIVQGGAVGLVAMAVLAGGGIFGAAGALRGARTPRDRDQAYAVGAMLIGIVASSFTFDLFSYQQATLVFFLLFGLLWSTVTVSYPTALVSLPHL